MRVLLICNDHYHPGDIPIRGLEPLLKKGITFDALQSVEEIDPRIIKNYPVVILAKTGRIVGSDTVPWKDDPAILTAFVEYVENGGGLLVVHNGTVANDETDEMHRLIGCRFVFHPSQVPVTVQPIKPHPVTDGVEMFCEKDEQYYVKLETDDVDIILAAYAPPQGDESKRTATSNVNHPGGIVPAGYVRNQGKGRICVITPGHNPEVWLNCNFQRLIENAVKWCGNYVNPRN